MSTVKRSPERKYVDPLDPIPVPEAKETDWAEWEDSVAFQDSQINDYQATEKMPLTPEDVHGIDAFATVTRKGR